MTDPSPLFHACDPARLPSLRSVGSCGNAPGEPASSVSTTTEIVRLKVNGDVHETGVPSHFTLLETLRYALGLTGSKQGRKLSQP